MKKTAILILVFALILNVLPCSAYTTNPSSFDDLPTTAKEYRAVVSLKNLGVIEGKRDRIFEPDANITREEFAKVISLADKIDDITKTVSADDILISEARDQFSDLSESDWFYKFVAYTNVNGLLVGVSESKFGVGSNITKQDAIVVLHRLLVNKVKSPEKVELKLPADVDLAEYAKEAVGTLAALGLIRFNEQDMYKPTEYITRAALCVVLYDTLTYIYSINTYGQYTRANLWKTYPDSESVHDKLYQYKPTEFNIDDMEQYPVFNEGFEDDKLVFDGGGILNGAVTDEVAYSGKKSVKCSVPEAGTQIVSGRFIYNVTPEEYGASFVLTTMIKSENLAKKIGYCIDIYDINNSYLKGFYESNSAVTKGTTDWVQIENVFSIPDDTAYFAIQVYFDSSNTGTIYYDDLQLKKVVMDSMKTIMLEPAYKGFIYGDGVINYDITLDRQGGVFDFDKLGVNIKLVDESDKVYIEKDIDYCTEKQNVTLKTDGIPEGDYWLETRLVDKESGKEIQLDYNTIKKRTEDYRPNFYVDEYGRTIKDGKPFFMRGQYDFGGDEGTETCHEILYSYYTDPDSNYNAIQTYELNPTRYNEPLFYSKYYKDLEKKGVGVTHALGWDFSHEGTEEEVEADKTGRTWRPDQSRYVYSNLINILKDHYPSDFGYYVFDELDMITMGEELKWRNVLYGVVDPDRPTMGAHYKDTYDYGILAKACDILIEDVYPIYGELTDDIAWKGRSVRSMVEAMPNRPVYTVVQAFKGGMISSKGKREPNETELRNMIWQSICEGAQGVTFWAAFVPFIYPNLKPLTNWQEYFDIQNELIGEVKLLENALTSAEIQPYYELKGEKTCFNITSRHYEGKSYIFLVNNTFDDQSAVLKLDDNVKNIKSLYTGKEYKMEKDGYFKIDYDPLMVDIFEYEQGTYLSSEAELKSAAFYISDDESAVINYTDDEIAIKLPQNIETLKYSLAIGRDAKLYINGALCETTGDVIVKGKSKIGIKIVSENEKFATEKTYKLIFEEETE